MSRLEGKIHAAVLLGLLLLFGNIAIDLYRGSALSRQEPYIFAASSAVTPRVKPGGTLILSYEFTRIRYCRTDLDRYIIRAVDNEVIWRDRIPGGAGNIGHVTVRNPVVVPLNATPGNYIFRTIVYATCSDRLYDAVAPDILFEIVA